MSEAKIKVPEGMLTAAKKAWHDLPATYGGKAAMVAGVEAALLWQRENVQRPTDYEFGELVNACRESVGVEEWEKSTEWMRAGILCHEWIRRMYDAPQPEVHPVLKEWMEDCEANGVDEATKVNYRRLFKRAFEAGQKVGPQ